MSRRAYASYDDNDRDAGVRPFVCEMEMRWGLRIVVCVVVTVPLLIAALLLRSFEIWFLALLAILASLVYLGWVALMHRAWLEITGDLNLRTRRFGGFHVIDGSSVRHVHEVVAGRSPDIKLVTDAGAVVVPTSRLAGGHRVLFTWLHERAPQADYDKRATRVRQILANDGWNVGLDKTT